jgi:hypothetical protein
LLLLLLRCLARLLLLLHGGPRSKGSPWVGLLLWLLLLHHAKHLGLLNQHAAAAADRHLLSSGAIPCS